MSLRASELAEEFGLSKGRISQLVASGKLAGCYVGEGIHRRFDKFACAEALNRQLDAGQMLGNGAQTRKVLKTVLAQGVDAAPPPVLDMPTQPKGEALLPSDPDRYELARSAKAEEELRAMRLRNGREEGQYVLASEVEMNVARVLAQTLAETDVFLRDCAQLIADKMGVDARQVRQIMMGAWREDRARQSDRLAASAVDANLSETEQAAQI